MLEHDQLLNYEIAELGQNYTGNGIIGRLL